MLAGRLILDFTDFLISFFNSIWRIYLVDFDILIGHALSASLSVDLQVVRILHCLSLLVVVRATGVQSAERLLGLLLVENIEVGAVRGLNSND